MINTNALKVLVAFMSATRLANALPQQPSVKSPYPNTLLATWTTDKVLGTLCTTDASLDDCKKASAEICASPNLKMDHEATVGKCKAIYMYDLQNSEPTRETCTAAYNQIHTAGIGGILGYSFVGQRSSDPLYGVWPLLTGGGGRCLVKPGDKIDPLHLHDLPNGATPASCNGNTNWDTTNRTSSLPECVVENLIQARVNPTCLAALATASYTGPFATIDGLSCFGDGAQAAQKAFQNCFANKAPPANAPPSTNIRPDNSILMPEQPKDVCQNLEDGFKFNCIEEENSYRNYFKCGERPRTDAYPELQDGRVLDPTVYREGTPERAQAEKDLADPSKNPDAGKPRDPPTSDGSGIQF